MQANLAELRRLFASRRAVAFWLFAVAAIVLGMVALGGLTRLTGSGLSITQWDPIMGAIPPMSDAAWHAAFAKYQQIPQYRLENFRMTLEGFKAIFWWEWTHRLLGPHRRFRVCGAVPAVLLDRRDPPRGVAAHAAALRARRAAGFRRLVDGDERVETRVSVSQYRLAIHLGVAIVLLGALLWIALEYLRKEIPSPPRMWGSGQGEGVSTADLAVDAPSPQPSPPLRGARGLLIFWFFSSTSKCFSARSLPDCTRAWSTTPGRRWTGACSRSSASPGRASSKTPAWRSSITASALHRLRRRADAGVARAQSTPESASRQRVGHRRGADRVPGGARHRHAGEPGAGRACGCASAHGRRAVLRSGVAGVRAQAIQLSTNVIPGEHRMPSMRCSPGDDK